MKLLHLAWEWPPAHAGGLGVAVAGLARAQRRAGFGVRVLLPRASGSAPGGGAFTPDDCGWGRAARPVRAWFELGAPAPAYEGGALGEIERFCDDVLARAASWELDLVHGHDWMTWPAAQALAEQRGIPFVAHVHATEGERNGAGGDPAIVRVEAAGLAGADRVLCVSGRTARAVALGYGVPEAKLRVVPNASVAERRPAPAARAGGPPTVLFLGRLTLQKGPRTFLHVAARIAAAEPETRFVVAGGGPLFAPLLEESIRLGLSRRLLWTGFLRARERERIFESATVVLVPSVSEPFGLVVLEAMRAGLPVVASRQSGATEIVEHVRRADAWDVDGFAAQTLALLRDPEERRALGRRAAAEARLLSWRRRSEDVARVYAELAGGRP